MRLRGGHLVHGLVLLEQLGVQCAAEVSSVSRLVLAEVVASEEAVEVGVACVRNVKGVRRNAVAALGAELGCVVLRQVWVRL